MWLDFQAFRVEAWLLSSQVEDNFSSFMEYLYQNHIILGLDTQMFRDEWVSLYLMFLIIQISLPFGIVFLLKVTKHATTLCLNFHPYKTSRKSRCEFSCPIEVLIIKWSKTMQDRKQEATVPLPSLGTSTLCPNNALYLLIQKYPAKIPLCHSLEPEPE